MKTLSMKKLSLAVLTAACVFGVGVAEAIPKVSVKISVPKGSAGDEKAVTAMYKGMPWLPCTAASASLGGVAIASATPLDKLQFDVEATNADDDKDTAKGFDYDLYVFFINHSAPVAGTNTYIYAVKSAAGINGSVLVAYTSSALMGAVAPSAYRFMDKTSFTEAGFKSTLFGSSIALDNGGGLDQGLWSIMAVMVRPDATAGVGGTLPSPAIVLGPVNPTIATITLLGGSPVAGYTPGGYAIQDPRNWAAWSMQTFVMGSPFQTEVGMGDGIATVSSGAGLCK